MAASALFPGLLRRRPLLLIVLAGLALRAGLLVGQVSLHPEMLQPGPPRLLEGDTGGRPVLSTFGYEASNVAYAVVCRGSGFADPFGVETGPTGWVSPGIAGLYIAAFALFGCHTPGAVLTVFAFALLASGLMILLMAAAGELLFHRRRSALAAAGLFALSPFDLALFTSASSLELNLHALLLLILLWLLLRLGGSSQAPEAPRPRRADLSRVAVFSLAAAVATLCNPIFVVVGAAGLTLARARRGLAATGAALGLFAAVHVALVGPYVLYQHRALGGWYLVKSNAPFEIYLGNRPGVDGALSGAAFRRHHPSQSRSELDEYRRLGERAYVAARWRSFRRSFRLGDFVRTTARRAFQYFFWVHPTGYEQPGLKLAAKRVLYSLPGLIFAAYLLHRRGRLSRGELLVYLLVLTYALPHLLAAVLPRYVLPVTPPALLLLAGLLTAPAVPPPATVAGAGGGEAP